MRVAIVCVLVAGCGRIEGYELLDQPRVDDFEADVQPLLERLGCSRGGGCHTTPLGGLQITESPDPAALEANYLGLKARVDLERPDESRVLYYLLPEAEEPRGLHYPTCFPSRETCAYRTLRAWIAWKASSDPRPADVCRENETIEPCP